MSVVTNILLSWYGGEEHGRGLSSPRHPLSAVNAWLVANGHAELADAAAALAGKKGFEARLYGTAANWLDLSGFLEAVRAAGWRYPSCVRVFYQEQDDQAFGVWTPTGGVMLAAQRC